VIKNVKGEPEGLVAVARDVTERKLAEEELNTLYSELEDRVEQRTTELAAINKELEAFSYSVSHDLRAPLRSIDGFSQALLEDYWTSLDDQGKDYLQRVRSAAQRMGSLIDDMLRLSRVSRAETHFEEVNLSSLVEEVAQELRNDQPDRIAQFVIQKKIQAYGDRSLLRILLENLLDNAWKFTSKVSGAQIEFGVVPRGDGHVYYVRDNGEGFDMSYVDKLFVPFQRLHTEAEFPGSGIGLAIAQRVVHRHEGEIWAEGTVGQGAVFYFTLWSAKDKKGK
jgi:light-regulated signal transduction histidine kinase (bacteriophytochrome)